MESDVKKMGVDKLNENKDLQEKMNKANKELMDLEKTANDQMVNLQNAQNLEAKDLNNTQQSQESRSQQDSLSQKLSDIAKQKMVVMNVYSALQMTMINNQKKVKRNIDNVR